MTNRITLFALATLALLLPGLAAAQTASSNPFRASPDAPPPSAVQPPYPAIHDLPPPRATQPLSTDEQLRLERELSGIRARHEKLREPGSNTDQSSSDKPPRSKAPKRGSAKQKPGS